MTVFAGRFGQQLKEAADRWQHPWLIGPGGASRCTAPPSAAGDPRRALVMPLRPVRRASSRAPHLRLAPTVTVVRCVLVAAAAE